MRRDRDRSVRIESGIPALLLLSAALVGLPGVSTAQVSLPPAADRPLAIDFATDPVLRLRSDAVDSAVFRATLSALLAAHPTTAEAQARADEAAALTDEARDRIGPSVTATMQSYRVLARDFDITNPGNLVERTRPLQRTDATVQVEQRLFDAGASIRRLRSARARERAALADAERARADLVLAFIAGWHELASYRALIAVIDAFLAQEPAMRAAVEQRIAQGASAEIERVQMDALLAQAKARRARAARGLATAEARFRADTGRDAPPGLARPPIAAIADGERATLIAAAGRSPLVDAAVARAEAAQEDARAARADRLPSLSAGVDAGRYGVFERERDYDVRARVTLRAPLYGAGLRARADQADARARAALAQADGTRSDAARDAAIALADIAALDQQLTALEHAYRAARVSRDAAVARFVGQRGTVNDIAAAEDNLVGAAAAYIQGLGEWGSARYAVLAQAGLLVERLGLPRDGERTGNE